MTDLARRLAEAAQHFTVNPADIDVGGGEQRLVRRLTRRRLARGAAGIGAALVLMVGLGIVLRGRLETPTLVATDESPRVVSFEDGSIATLIRGADLQRISAANTADITLQLNAGTSRFEVAKRPARTFRVIAGNVTVEVVGTAFTVERIGSGARVAVEHGRVRVSWADGQTYLQAAQSGQFPPKAAPTIEPIPAPAPIIPPTLRTAVPPSVKSSWRALAKEGHYDRAYKALGEAGPAAVKDEPGDLLTAADVARLSGHPAEALPSLRRVVGRYRSDPRASLAAFTLGRVLLDETHDPRAAAEAFALVRTLDPQSPLMEDALAREVEALSRTGAGELAKARAEEYLRRFPSGAKADVVRRSAGLK